MASQRVAKQLLRAAPLTSTRGAAAGFQGWPENFQSVQRNPAEGTRENLLPGFLIVPGYDPREGQSDDTGQWRNSGKGRLLQSP